MKMGKTALTLKGKPHKKLRTTNYPMDEKEFIEKLNAVHKFPAVYMFKFVMPVGEGKMEDLVQLFDETSEKSLKNSSNGKYVSITIKELMLSAEKVVERYRLANKIKGIIAL